MLSQQILSTCTPVGWITTKGIFAFLLNVLMYLLTMVSMHRNFIQFYSTKSERDRNLRKEYDTQMEYRKHLQAFIDRWRYNANRAAQAQSKIKILEKVCFYTLVGNIRISLFRSYQSCILLKRKKPRRSSSLKLKRSLLRYCS